MDSSIQVPDERGERPVSAAGGCLCGAVGFSLRLPSKWVAHCHCRRCQRAHGAAFVTWIGMQADRVVFDADAADNLNWYRAPGGAERGFCKSCGSSMFFRADRWPGELHVARASVNDAIDQPPGGHAYFDTHVDWVHLADDLPTSNDPDRVD